MTSPSPSTHAERGLPPPTLAPPAYGWQLDAAQRSVAEVFVSIANPYTPAAEAPVDRLSAVREWIWRHSSQPNGDPWDSDPEHLDWAAQNLLNDLVPLNSTNPQPASSTHPRADTARTPGRSLHFPR